MWVLNFLSARFRLLLRGSGDRIGSECVSDLQSLAPWCRGDVLTVLRERGQDR